MNDELKMGIDIEKEHKPTIDWIKSYYEENGHFPPDEEVYAKISKDHIQEFKKYYTALKEMEAELKAEQEGQRHLSNEDKEKIKDWLLKSNDVSDEKFHEFGKTLGVNQHEIESYVYELAKELEIEIEDTDKKPEGNEEPKAESEIKENVGSNSVMTSTGEPVMGSGQSMPIVTNIFPKLKNDVDKKGNIKKRKNKKAGLKGNAWEYWQKQMKKNWKPTPNLTVIGGMKEALESGKSVKEIYEELNKIEKMF